MSSLYLPAVQRSWLHQSHTATKAASRSPSPTPAGADGAGGAGGEKREEILSAEQGINSRLAVDLQEQDFLRHINRADHLPGRGHHAQQARVMRNMYGYAPIGSMYDAQELSSEEEKWGSKQKKVANFGKRHLIRIGNTRTQQEEENSLEEIEAHRTGFVEDSEGSDAEGGPGVFIGGHTGHAAANLAAQRRQLEEAAAARADRANRRAALARALEAAEAGEEPARTRSNEADSPAQADETDSMETGGGAGAPVDDSFEARDMDADIEDLDGD